MCLGWCVPSCQALFYARGWKTEGVGGISCCFLFVFSLDLSRLQVVTVCLVRKKWWL